MGNAATASVQVVWLKDTDATLDKYDGVRQATATGVRTSNDVLAVYTCAAARDAAKVTLTDEHCTAFTGPGQEPCESTTCRLVQLEGRRDREDAAVVRRPAAFAPTQLEFERGAALDTDPGDADDAAACAPAWPASARAADGEPLTKSLSAGVAELPAGRVNLVPVAWRVGSIWDVDSGR